MKYRLILLVVVAALAFAEHKDGRASLQETPADFYRRIEGVIKVPFRSEENVTAENGNQCLLKALKRCRCGSRCAASFHPPSRTCVTSAPFFELLSLKESSSIIEQTPGEAWLTYDWFSHSSVTDVPPPSGLWLFDSVSKGRNFGAEGRRMDGSFKKVTWTEEGPRGRKLPLKYPLLSEGSSEVRIQNKHNGEHLIDFSRPFTIAMWMKAVNEGNSGGGFSDLAGFRLGECGTSSKFFYFAQGRASGYLSLRPNFPNHGYLSDNFPSPHNEWRHVAAVYNGPGDVQFYWNGKFVKMERKDTYDTSVRNLNVICLKKCYSLPPSVACLSIFKHPLSQAQVAHVMRKYP